MRSTSVARWSSGGLELLELGLAGGAVDRFVLAFRTPWAVGRFEMRGSCAGAGK
jgi:hypothetical protein